MSSLLSRFSVAKELLEFFWKERLWWMIPLVLVLLFIGVLVLFAQSSPMAPMLYATF